LGYDLIPWALFWILQYGKNGVNESCDILN
jgi:hypothetical protein